MHLLQRVLLKLMAWLYSCYGPYIYLCKRHSTEIIIRLIIDYIKLFLARTQLHVTLQYYVNFIIHLIYQKVGHKSFS